MTSEPKVEPSTQRQDFTDFVASKYGVSRDAAQAVLGEWLCHYLPSSHAVAIAEARRPPSKAKRAAATPAA